MKFKELPIEKVLEMRQRVMYPERSVEEMRLDDDAEGLHLAIWIDEKPISIISIFNRGDEWQFRKFATEVEYQGKGYGTKLLQHVMSAAGKKGAKRIWCNARVNVCAYYERFGMQKTGEAWAKHGIDFIVMEKIFA